MMPEVAVFCSGSRVGCVSMSPSEIGRYFVPWCRIRARLGTAGRCHGFNRRFIAKEGKGPYLAVE